MPGCLLNGWGEALLAAVSGGVLLVPVQLKGGMIQLTQAAACPFSRFVAELSPPDFDMYTILPC